MEVSNGCWWLRMTQRPGREIPAMAGGRGPLDWGIFLPWLSLILSRLSHYYSFEYVISRSNHSTNLDFHFSFYQKPTFGIWGHLNYFGYGDTLFAMSLKPFAETIALTKKQCLESATNVLFLLSDAITVKYCLRQWQIIALRTALFYFISRPPLPPPILLHFLLISPWHHFNDNG